MHRTLSRIEWRAILTDTGSNAVTNSTSTEVRGTDGALAAVRVVLVGTSHPGNIGASARAIKAMGLRHMTLVSPKTFPAAEATAMASGADDILAIARVTDTLAEAIEDCCLVIGTTARARHLQWPVIAPGEAAAAIAGAVNDGPVAIVFGREQSGLSNAELDLCHRAIRIPTAPDFNSLNLAQAVQICAYEIRKALVNDHAAEPDAADGRDAPVTAAALGNLHQHLMDTMALVGYLDPENPKLLVRRMRRMLNRAGLLTSETQILRGFLAAIEHEIKAQRGN